MAMWSCPISKATNTIWVRVWLKAIVTQNPIGDTFCKKYILKVVQYYITTKGNKVLLYNTAYKPVANARVGMCLGAQVHAHEGHELGCMWGTYGAWVGTWMVDELVLRQWIQHIKHYKCVNTSWCAFECTSLHMCGVWVGVHLGAWVGTYVGHKLVHMWCTYRVQVGAHIVDKLVLQRWI